MVNAAGKLRVWLPSCVSGDELYTLMIVLKESGWLDHAEITASALSERSIDIIKTGLLKMNKIEVSKDNYQRFQGRSSLTEYYSMRSEEAYRDPELVKDVKFFIQDLDFSNSPKPFDLIIFRNQMLYYNQTLQDKIAAILYNSLVPGGYLVTGTRERLTLSDEHKVLKLVSEHESIYRKK
jgi:chemotaxis protein methyltransferase CheR